MSLICGALAWLSERTDELGLLRSQSASEDATATEQAASEPSWLAAFGAASVQRAEQQQQALARDALSGVEKVRAEQGEKDAKKRRSGGFAFAHQEKKRRRRQAAANGVAVSSSDAADESDEHLVDAYDSDRVAHVDGSDSDGDDSSGRSGGRAGGRFGPPGADERPEFGVVKIIYCSRTHSQISQFVREIRKTAFGERIRVVSLGSRKNLCTNPSVAALRSDAQMTDKCLDMLQGSKSAVKKDAKSKKTAKCPFYEKELLGHYRDHALVRERWRTLTLCDAGARGTDALHYVCTVCEGGGARHRGPARPGG